MSEFTTSELVMIALVLSQNADEYGDSERFVVQTARKARRMANDRQTRGDGA